MQPVGDDPEADHDRARTRRRPRPASAASCAARRAPRRAARDDHGDAEDRGAGAEAQVEEVERDQREAGEEERALRLATRSRGVGCILNRARRRARRPPCSPRTEGVAARRGTASPGSPRATPSPSRRPWMLVISSVPSRCCGSRAPRPPARRSSGRRRAPCSTPSTVNVASPSGRRTPPGRDAVRDGPRPGAVWFIKNEAPTPWSRRGRAGTPSRWRGRPRLEHDRLHAHTSPS